jgi:hypothetical protein
LLETTRRDSSRSITEDQSAMSGVILGVTRPATGAWPRQRTFAHANTADLALNVADVFASLR